MPYGLSPFVDNSTNMIVRDCRDDNYYLENNTGSDSAMDDSQLMSSVNQSGSHVRHSNGCGLMLAILAVCLVIGMALIFMVPV